MDNVGHPVNMKQDVNVQMFTLKTVGQSSRFNHFPIPKYVGRTFYTKKVASPRPICDTFFHCLKIILITYSIYIYIYMNIHHVAVYIHMRIHVFAFFVRVKKH